MKPADQFGISSVIIRLFAIIWGVIILVDFCIRQPFYGKLLASFPYFQLFLMLIIMIAAFTLWQVGWSHLSKRQLIFRKINGLSLYLLLLLGMTITFLYVGHEDVMIKGGRAQHIFKQDLFGPTAYFLANTVMWHLYLLLLGMAGYTAGSRLLQLLPQPFPIRGRVLVEMALGITLITLFLFLLGVFSLLNTWVVWGLFLLCIVQNYKVVLPFLKKTFVQRSAPISVNWLGVAAAAILLLFTILNLVTIIRPFPIGFDALQLYVNIPNLIGQEHGLIQGGQAYNWGLFMGVGFIMTGETVPVLLISTVPLILALFGIYHLARNFLSESLSLVACAIFYTMPVVVWPATMEVKVDLALMFYVVSALLMMWPAIFRKDKEGVESAWNWKNALLVGGLLGFAFGIKYTAFMAIAALTAIWLYRSLKAFGLGGFLLFTLGVICIFQVDALYVPRTSDAGYFISGVVLSIAGIGMIIYSWMVIKTNLIAIGKPVMIMALTAALVFAPWLIKHGVENGGIGTESLLIGKSPAPSFDAPPAPWLEPTSMNVYSDDPALNNYFAQADPIPARAERWEGYNRESTAKYEELQRYLGYDEGSMKYVTLPYDVTVSANVANLTSPDIGFLFLMLFPLLSLFKRRKSWYLNIMKAAGWFLWLALCFTTVLHTLAQQYGFSTAQEVIDQPLAEDAGWINNLFHIVYVPVSGLLLALGSLVSPLSDQLAALDHGWIFLFIAVAAGILFLLFRPDKAEDCHWPSATFMYGSVFYLILWWAMASGITWYALPGFAMLSISLLVMAKPWWNEGGAQKIVMGAAVLIWFVLAIGWRMNTTNALVDGYEAPVLKNYLPFMAGMESSEDVKERIIPNFTKALAYLNEDEDKRIIRIGTYFNYFIRENEQRVYEDNQLDLVNDLMRPQLTPDRVIDLLEYNRVGYILVDLNTHTIDNTPEKTLTKKMERFLNFALDNPEKLELLVTDRVVSRPDGDMTIPFKGKEVKAMNHIVGVEVVSYGSFALFKVNFDG